MTTEEIRDFEAWVERANAALEEKRSSKAIVAKKTLGCMIAQSENPNPDLRDEYYRIYKDIGVLINSKTIWIT